MAKKANKVENKVKKSSKISFTDFKQVLSVFSDERFKYVIGIVLLLLSVFITVAFVSYLFTWKIDQSKLDISLYTFLTDENHIAENWAGKMGAVISNLFMNNWFGISSFSIVLILLIAGLKLLKVELLPLSKTIKSTILISIWLSISLAFFFGEVKDYFFLGGAHGYFISKWLNSFAGKAGTFIIIIITAFALLIYTFKNSLQWFKDLFNKREIENVEEEEDKDKEDEIIEANFEDTIELEIPKEVFFNDDDNDFVKKEPAPLKTNDVTLTIESKKEEKIIDDIDIIHEMPHAKGDYDPKLDLENYKYPPIELLDDHKSSDSEVTETELISNKNKIVETLANYKIQIDKIKATIGPTVTLYEIIPAPGVRIAKIKNLEDDIALSLAALGIRIIAPMPGKGTIGIEVPNQNPEIVSMRSVVSSSKFQESKFDLPIVLGKTISNENYVVDLTKMPHLLVAGATGQGKSVGLNAILTSLLYKKHPSQLKFVLIDPKKVELTVYSKIEKHFLAKLPDAEDAIITDTQKVITTLKSLTILMDTRYDLLKKAHVRNIKEYNDKFIKRKLNPENGHSFFPYIVVIIDEFADLIMTAGREIEEPIARIAQLARAVGIHLIIATQRPSTNIITGSIKANFPARVAFRVSSMIDSRTILDTPGANQLIGRGDMLITQGNELIRVQCAFVDTPEIDRITDFISEQQSYATAYELPEVKDENVASMKDNDPNSRDEYFMEAAKLVVMHQQGSTSLIQRKFSLGYNRAGRIIDQLESAGIVGPYEGSKARQVKFSDLPSLEQYLNNMN